MKQEERSKEMQERYKEWRENMMQGGKALRDHLSIASSATLGIDGDDSQSVNRLHN